MILKQMCVLNTFFYVCTLLCFGDILYENIAQKYVDRLVYLQLVNNLRLANKTNKLCGLSLRANYID
jgi:hypothetical protein